MKKIMFLLAPLISITLARAECRNYRPTTPDCDFYSQCLEKKHNCGESGYPLGYGLKYCQRFISLNTPNAFEGLSLSAEGVRWRDRTLVCLQDELIRREFQQGFASCEEIKEDGFATHASCYARAESSICDLPLGDWTSISRVVDVKDYASIDSVKQIVEVIIACGDRVLDDYHAAKDELFFYKNVASNHRRSSGRITLAHDSRTDFRQIGEIPIELIDRVENSRKKLKFIEFLKEKKYESKK